MANSQTVQLNITGNISALKNALSQTLVAYQDAINSVFPQMPAYDRGKMAMRGSADIFKKQIQHQSRLQTIAYNGVIQRQLSEQRKRDFIEKENLRQKNRMEIHTIENIGRIVGQFSTSLINTTAAVKLMQITFTKLREIGVGGYLKQKGQNFATKAQGFANKLTNTSTKFGSFNIRPLKHPLTATVNAFKKLGPIFKTLPRTVGTNTVGAFKKLGKTFNDFIDLKALRALYKSKKGTMSPFQVLAQAVNARGGGLAGAFSQIVNKKFLTNPTGNVGKVKNVFATLRNDLVDAHMLRKKFGGKQANGTVVSSALNGKYAGLNVSARAKQIASHGVFAGLFGKGAKGFLSGAINKGIGFGSKIKGLVGGPKGGAVKAVAGITLGAPLMAMAKVGKTVVGYFVNIAKSAETVQKLSELIALPFKLIFTLGAIPLLTSFIPILKEMISWITENKDTIQAIGDALARIFQQVVTPETIGIVTKLLDGFAEVLAFLGMKLEENFKTVNMNSVASFIATTITALVGFIQDCLIGLVQWCYSAEGQAFIISMAEGVGKLIGTLVVLLIEMLPIFLEIIVVAIAGIVEGVVSTIIKMLAGFVDSIDQATGGALTGVANFIINVVNWFIDRINDVASLFSWINNGWQLDHVQAWDTGSVGTNFSNAATNLTNNMTISNIYSIANNNTLTSNDSIKALLSTGGY